MRTPYPNELKHYGIPGQKWGVRRGPPYPIEDTVLKKGTKLSSVSLYSAPLDKVIKDKWLYTYNPDDKWDSAIYKGPFASFKSNNFWRVFEHNFEVVRDLSMPTSAERLAEFKSLYQKYSDIVAKDLSRVQDIFRQYGDGTNLSKAAVDVNVRNLISEKDYKAAYELFNHAMEAVSQFQSTLKYAEIMSKKYDAMVDDNNQGVYNDAHDPVIIFNMNNSLREVGNSRPISSEEITDNMNSVRDTLKQYGRKMAL